MSQLLLFSKLFPRKSLELTQELSHCLRVGLHKTMNQIKQNKARQQLGRRPRLVQRSQMAFPVALCAAALTGSLSGATNRTLSQHVADSVTVRHFTIGRLLHLVSNAFFPSVNTEIFLKTHTGGPVCTSTPAPLWAGSRPGVLYIATLCPILHRVSWWRLAGSRLSSDCRE